MCYHKSNKATLPELSELYGAKYADRVEDTYRIYYHENGYNYLSSPIITAEDPGQLLMFNWGFIHSKQKGLAEALKARVHTLNCRAEEMFETYSYKQAALQGKRCLVPVTGFFEPHWLDEKGKEKIPYYIRLKDQYIFSLAGLYTTWTDPATEQVYNTYTLLTTQSIADSKIGKIHNSKDRKVVIMPREYEKDWLNPNLTKEDVLELTKAFDTHNDDEIEAYTVSKALHNAKMISDTPDILNQVNYEPVKKDIQTSLF